MDLRGTFRATIEKYDMLGPGDGVLVAVSGGADSMALLHLLGELKEALRLRLEVGHLQHGIRGEEAAADARFVAETAERMGLPFHIKEIDLPRMKSERGKGNIEALAREERYRYFAAAAEERGLGKIATAHNRDDQAETVLMRLLRGAGRRGLGGMPAAQPVNGIAKEAAKSLVLIRPLIDASRAEILEYLAAQGLAHRSDSTNLERAYLRNWIRLDLLPLLEERAGAQFSSRLARLAGIWRGEDEILERLAAERLSRIRDGEAIARTALLAEDRALQRRLLRLWIEQTLGDLRRIDLRHIEEALLFIESGPPQGRLAIPRGWDLVKEYERFRLERRIGKRKPVCYSYALRPGAAVTIAEADMEIHSTRLSLAPPLPETDLEALFDLSVLPQPLTVRNFRPGDRFRPLGMSGHKKVKDFFIDRKIPLSVRSVMPLLATDEEVLWIPGYGRSEVGSIGPKTTEILRVKAVRRSL